MRAASVLFLALGLAWTPLAAPRVLDQSPAGFTVENTVEVGVDSRRAWQALVQEVGRWWPPDHTWYGNAAGLFIEARAGGCFCEHHGDRQALHMTVARVEPGRMLRLLGGLGPLQGMGLHGVLDFRLEPVDGGTRITMRYRAGGYAPEGLERLVPVVDAVQAQQLGALAAHLGGDRLRAD